MAQTRKNAMTAVRAKGWNVVDQVVAFGCLGDFYMRLIGMSFRDIYGRGDWGYTKHLSLEFASDGAMQTRQREFLNDKANFEAFDVIFGSNN